DALRKDRLPGTSLTAAVSDYGPMTGVAKDLWEGTAFIDRMASPKGALEPDRPTRLAEFKDGSSQTILITEDPGRPKHWLRGAKPGPQHSDPGCSNVSVEGGRVTGAGWADPANDFPLHGFSRDGLSCPGPCPMNCTNNNEAFSFHPGGVNAVFADG